MTSPQFVRTQPGANIAAPAQAEVDPTNSWGYSPMSEDEPNDVLTKAPAVRPAIAGLIRQAHPMPKSKIPVSKMTPEQLAAYRAASDESKTKSQEWMKANPRSADNIVSHWDQSTPAHKEQGMNWYKDAHHAANVMARDHGITTNQAAGLIANYSPKQHWAQNLRMASITAGGQILGGPKKPGDAEGFMASTGQANASKRILAGEDYHDVFAGKKVSAFGHLIEHGQDTDPNDPQVVVDRHALGVAHGGYADDGIFAHSGVSSSPRKDGSSPVYDETSQLYKDAADKINARDGGHNGVPIAPHQLQAATWLTRQRLNAEGGYDADDAEKGAKSGATQAKIALGNTNKWNEYAAKVHPELVNRVPGTGFSKEVGQGGLANPQDFTNSTPIPKAAKMEFVRTASSAFTYDSIADQFKTSDLSSDFRCTCGTKFATANIGLHRCEGCNKTYTSFDIIDGNRTASAGSTTRIVREVKEFRDRVLARKSSLQIPPYVRR